jgi:hypothetical protein
MVASTLILGLKMRVDHRSILYGNDRLILSYLMMCILWGVVVVFIMLNEEILHRVV